MMRVIKNHYFVLILIFSSIYLLLEIFRSSFVIDGVRYFALFDDEMVSMRYAYNLSQGLGLVWNTGERIEGFTNPLWVVFMTFIHLLSVPLPLTSLIIQLANLGFFLVALVFVKKIADRISNQNPLVTASAVFLTAFYYPIMQWTFLGTEVTPLLLLLMATIYYVLTVNEKKKNIFVVFILLLLAPLIRLEMVIPSVVIIGYLWFYHRRDHKRAIILGVTGFLLSLLFQVGLRFWYYSDFLPNTYYLKMTGYPTFFRISRGIITQGQFLMSLNWLVVMVVGVFAFRQKNKVFTLFVALIVSMLLYTMYVGGDVWEYFGGSNRFMTITMPLFFILVSYIAYTLLSYLKVRKAVVMRYFFLLPLIYLVTINFASPEMFLESILLKQPQFIPANKVNTERALLIDKITDEKAKIAVHWAGTTPYFSQRTYIDLLGKADKTIASQKAHQDTGMPFWMRLYYFLPGHMKWDYAYSIGKLKPDIIAERSLPDEAKPYLTDYQQLQIENFVFYVKKDSSHVHLTGVKTSTDIPSWSPPYQLLQ